MLSQELAQPKATAPEHGFIVPNIELPPLCSPKFRPGAPSEEAQVLANIISDVITNAGCVDLKDLCIVKEKLVWVLYCDMNCLDYDGCVLDAAIMALIAALQSRKFISATPQSVHRIMTIFMLSVKLPTVVYDYDTNLYKVNEEVKNYIAVKSCPVATSFMVFDE